MQKLGGQYFYVYEYFDGKVLNNKDISKLDCQKIAMVLSKIHGIDMKSQKLSSIPINIDWDNYLKLAKEQCQLIFPLLVANRELLYENQNNSNIAIHNIPPLISICHNDMDSKNILWKNDHFRIIDLECLSYSNPYLELFELALSWSGFEECNINFAFLKAFMDAYFKDNPQINLDWESLYYSNYRKLEWLEYNVKRALFIECSKAEEQKLAIKQVQSTIEQLIYYKKIKVEFRDCLSAINKDV